ncbi:MAG: pentapeptide repeat-containing protein [Patescibacteria group bacterium]
MAINLAEKSFKLENTFGHTYIALFSVDKTTSFKKDSDYQEFVRFMMNKVKEAQQSGLFNEDTTYALGGFDVQVTCSGIKGNDIVITIGGSCSKSMLEPTPLAGFGRPLESLLNGFFGTKYVLSDEPIEGAHSFNILAVELDQKMLVNNLGQELDENAYHTSETSHANTNPVANSPLMRYSYDRYDTPSHYYFYNPLGDLIDVTANVYWNMFHIEVNGFRYYPNSGNFIYMDTWNHSQGVSVGNDCNECIPACEIPDCSVPDCDASGCDLKGCDTGCEPGGCDTGGCDLSGCDAGGCDLGGCDAGGCNF